MAGEFDATLKTLLEVSPQDWLAFVGAPPGQARVIDADVSTVVGARADKVLRVEGRQPFLVHLEFHAGHDGNLLPERLARYNILLTYRHDLTVDSTAVVLIRDADSPQLTGEYWRELPDGRRRLAVWYQVIRVWEIPVETLLAGGPGLLPLAVLAVADPAELPAVVAQVKQKLPDPAGSQKALDLWVTTWMLLGLTQPAELVNFLLPEVKHMVESSTYQWLVEQSHNSGLLEGQAKGRAEEARKLLLVLGTDRFGAPDAAVRAALEAVTDLDVLEAMARHVLHATGWADLLAVPPPQAPGGPNGAAGAN